MDADDRTSAPRAEPQPRSRQPVTEDQLAMRTALVVHEMRDDSRFAIERLCEAHEQGASFAIVVSARPKRSARVEAIDLGTWVLDRLPLPRG